MSPIRRSPVRHIALPLLVPLFVACSEPLGDFPDGVVTRDSAGVAMVTSYRAQWHAGDAWQVDTVPRMSLGGTESDTNQHWAFLEASALLHDGRVVLGVQGQLRWFSADGTHLRTSPTGDGPGEFRSIAAIHDLPGDSVRVHAAGGRKYAVFAPDGAFVYERQADSDKLRSLGRWIECASAIFADGSRLMCQRDSSIPVTATNRPSHVTASGLTSPGAGLLRTLHRVWLVTPSLEAAYPLGMGAGIEQFGVETSRGVQFVVHPFYSRSIAAAGGTPLRIATALNPDYRIELWRSDGTLERVVIRSGARRAPTVAELANVSSALAGDVRGSDPATVDQVLAEVATPDSLPAIAGITVTSRGELLVMREGHLPSHTHSLYDVFNREGSWLGTLRLLGPRFIVSVGDETMLTYRLSVDGVVLAEVLGYRR